MQPGAGVSPEGPPVGDGRGELIQLPPKDTGGCELSDLSSPRALTFDLMNMVISFKRMVIFLEPVNDTVELVRYLLGWKMPVFSLLFCILLNVLFLTLSEVAWFSLLLLGVSTPAALGYLQDRSQSQATEAALQRKRHHAVQRRDLQTVHLTRQEAMLEVKGLLKQLDEILSQACVSAESVYSVLYWESHTASSLFYGSLMVVLCFLYFAPLGWALAMFNSALFLWNRDFCRVLLELREMFRQGQAPPAEGEPENPEPEPTSFVDQTPTPTSLEDLSPGSIEEAEEAEPDEEFKDAIEEPPLVLVDAPLALVVRPADWLPDLPWRHVAPPPGTETKEDDDVPPGVPEFDTLSDNGLLSRNEPIRSKVSKLTEKLRKRYPTNNTGNCSNCAAVFSVLKKRRNCSNCGNSFCSRCCSYKVLKSCMGATAPEAQRETVFVCGACNLSLSK
ncbi:protrudin isoform X1 [Anguilla rostrata]|uniref:protrudin isoform X1 n=1 Tax=Anguilla anguilla TaxID=7936 RepID=UPI0015AB99D5|nr:protrudin isoform X1 [Anguilla anguilla]XP_035261619.1 protrudin isoform X1 [Anguilla anguilla]